MSHHKPILMARIDGISLTDRIGPKGVYMEHTESGKSGKEIKLMLANPGLELLDDPHFQAGKTIEWRFGYPGNLSPTYSAKVFVVEPTFDPWNGFTLTFYAYDAITTLLGGVRQKVWRHPTDAQVTQSWVVEQIAKEYGLQTDIEETKNFVTEIAQSTSDFVFIRDILAPDAVAKNPERSGAYRVWIDSLDGILHFRPAPAYLKPKKTYRFFTETENPSLISFRPKLNIQRPDDAGAANTKVRDITGAGEVLDEESTPENAKRVTTPGTASLNEVTGEWSFNEAGAVREDPTSADPVSNSSNAKDRGDASLSKKEESGIETEIVLIGDPQLVANDIIEVTNVGRQFSGAYVCDEVRHVINVDGGFTTTVTAFANAAKDNAGGTLADTGATDGGTQANPEASDSVAVFNEITGESLPNQGRP